MNKLSFETAKTLDEVLTKFEDADNVLKTCMKGCPAVIACEANMLRVRLRLAKLAVEDIKRDVLELPKHIDPDD